MERERRRKKKRAQTSALAWRISSGAFHDDGANQRPLGASSPSTTTEVDRVAVTLGVVGSGAEMTRHEAGASQAPSFMTVEVNRDSDLQDKKKVKKDKSMKKEKKMK